jgi:hypothetical protein
LGKQQYGSSWQLKLTGLMGIAGGITSQEFLFQINFNKGKLSITNSYHKSYAQQRKINPISQSLEPTFFGLELHSVAERKKIDVTGISAMA